MDSMATSIFQATRGAKKALELPEGQEEMILEETEGCCGSSTETAGD